MESSSPITSLNSYPVLHHDEPSLVPPTPPVPSTVMDINSSSSSSSVMNSNPTNDSQEYNQPRVGAQSLPRITRRIQHVPAIPDNAVPGWRIYTNPNQLGQDYHVINIQMVQNHHYVQVIGDRMIAPNTGTSLGKIFLSLTYQAAIGFALLHYQSLSSSSSSSSSYTGDHSVPPLIVGVPTVVGFAASLIGILLRNSYPMAAAIVETFGSVSAAIGFFVMMGVFLSSISQWIGWVAGIGCFIAFVFALLKMR